MFLVGFGPKNYARHKFLMALTDSGVVCSIYGRSAARVKCGYSKNCKEQRMAQLHRPPLVSDLSNAAYISHYGSTDSGGGGVQRIIGNFWLIGPRAGIDRAMAWAG